MLTGLVVVAGYCSRCWRGSRRREADTSLSPPCVCSRSHRRVSSSPSCSKYLPTRTTSCRPPTLRKKVSRSRSFRLINTNNILSVLDLSPKWEENENDRRTIKNDHKIKDKDQSKFSIPFSLGVNCVLCKQIWKRCRFLFRDYVNKPLPVVLLAGSKEASEKETHKPLGNLPAFKWAAVYRSLRPFLRPFGDSGEGRLDFYHRSLSKAVRKK